jgi:hypothetical protein
MYTAARNRPLPPPGQRRGRGTELALETVADGPPGPLTRVPEAETPSRAGDR